MFKSVSFYIAMVAAKATLAILKIAGRQGGQLPGVVAEKICPTFFAQIDKPERVFFITGTNGKTTTTNLLDDILEDNNVEFVDNRAGGNIRNGIESALIKNATWAGRQKIQLAVMELDELSSRIVLPYVTPDMILVTNLYRDSFLRNANPDFIFNTLNSAISKRTELVLNADDLISARLGDHVEAKTFFSIAKLDGDVDEPEGIVCDLNACPVCGGQFEYDYCHLRHLGHATCNNCGFTNPAPDFLLKSFDPQTNTFVIAELNEPGSPEYTYRITSYSITNLYNLFAAIIAARKIGLSPEQIERSLEKGINVTALRYGEKTCCGKRLVSVASKGENSTATSCALNTIIGEPGSKAVVLNLLDAYHNKPGSAHTEFTGWYYQADFEYLNDEQVKQVVVLGEGTQDLALRLAIAGIDPDKLSFATTPQESAEMLRLDDVESVFWAFDIFNSDETNASRDRVIEILEGGRQ